MVRSNSGDAVKSKGLPPALDRKILDAKRIPPPDRIPRRSRKTIPEEEVSVSVLSALTADFHNALQQSMKGLIEAGKVLVRAKSELKHGQWEEWVICTLHFGERKRNGKANLREAQVLMLLSRHPVISNPKNFGALPPRLRTLTELSQVPDEDLLEHIKTGVVHHGITREDAARLKPRLPKPRREGDDFAPALHDAIKALHHFCIHVGRPDVLRAYDRSLKREPGLPSEDEFNGAIQFAKKIYDSIGEQ
jgi:hypothetical protein